MSDPSLTRVHLYTCTGIQLNADRSNLSEEQSCSPQDITFYFRWDQSAEALQKVRLSMSNSFPIVRSCVSLLQCWRALLLCEVGAVDPTERPIRCARDRCEKRIVWGGFSFIVRATLLSLLHHHLRSKVFCEVLFAVISGDNTPCVS